MPSLSGVQDVNNKVTAVPNSGGGVAVEDTNNEGSPEQQVRTRIFPSLPIQQLILYHQYIIIIRM